MKSSVERERGNVAVRERQSLLSEPSLRINESLDLDTVLRELVESDRKLAVATYGGIALLDQSGQFRPRNPRSGRGGTSGTAGPTRRAVAFLVPEQLRLSDFGAQAG